LVNNQVAVAMIKKDQEIMYWDEHSGEFDTIYTHDKSGFSQPSGQYISPRHVPTLSVHNGAVPAHNRQFLP
jgi:hypothetical protein